MNARAPRARFLIERSVGHGRAGVAQPSRGDRPSETPYPSGYDRDDASPTLAQRAAAELLRLSEDVEPGPGEDPADLKELSAAFVESKLTADPD